MAAEEWPPLAVVIPDDIRELDADVAAYHRELRQRRRQARLDRLVLRRHWERFGVVAPLVVLSLVIVTLSGGLMSVFSDRPATTEPPAPLAQTAIDPGMVGGLLPALTVRVDGNATPLREIRPALVAVLPSGCDCAGLVRALVRQTSEYSLRLVLVTPALGREEARDLRDAALGRATFAVDDSGQLARLFGPHSLVFVHADGTVRAIEREPKSTERFELQLSQLATARR